MGVDSLSFPVGFKRFTEGDTALAGRNPTQELPQAQGGNAYIRNIP